MARRVFSLVLLLAACDPQAKGGATQANALGAGGRPGVLSKGQESCRATADCEEGLRCVENTCRNLDVSRMGEYFWAAGQIAAEKGKLNEAVTAFNKALVTFEAEKKDVPARLLCDFGATARRHKGDANVAARLLHRCVLASPPMTAERMRGLRELAELEAVGLEPSVMKRDSPADSYIVGPAQAPEVKGVKVEVTRTTPARDKGYEAWAKRVETDPAPKDALMKCLGDYTAKTQKTKLSVSMPLKLKAQIGDDDIYVGGKLDLLPDPAAKGDEAAGGQCVLAALSPVAADFQKTGSSDSWQGTITITLSPE